MSWGGDPRKPVEPAGSGPRLHPRKSFEAVEGDGAAALAPLAAERGRGGRASCATPSSASCCGGPRSWRQLSAELERSNKELEAFSYSVSHDLRAPFRHIVGYAELLREEEGERLSERGPPLRRHDHRVGPVSAGTLVDNLLASPRWAGRATAAGPHRHERAGPRGASGERRSARPAGRRSPGRSATCRPPRATRDAPAGPRQPRFQRPEVHPPPRGGGDRDRRRDGAGETVYSVARQRRRLRHGATPTSCSASSSGCTGWRSSRAPASAWPTSAASSSATAAGPGRRARSTGARPSTSPCRGARRGSLSTWPTLKPILLVEDNPKDVELTLAALGKSQLANEVVVARDGAEALDYLLSRGILRVAPAGQPGGGPARPEAAQGRRPRGPRARSRATPDSGASRS